MDGLHAITVALAVSVLCIYSLASATQTSDPASDYETRFGVPPDRRLDLDLDADGLPDVLLSNQAFQNGRAGRIWAVYQSNLEGWKFLETPAIFQPEPLQIVPATKDSPPSLLTFWPSGAGKGIVRRIRLTKNGPTDEVVEQIEAQEVHKYFEKAASRSAASAAPPVSAPPPLDATKTPRSAASASQRKGWLWIIGAVLVFLAVSAVRRLTMKDR